RRWLEARGCRVVTGSPFNLSRAPGGGVALLGVPCDVLVRHYKTDWWSEREPARDDDEPFTDSEPLAAQLGLVIDAELAGRVDDATWADAIAHARRGRWIAQRHFAARRDADGRCANVGVYVVGGEASGFFSRVHRGATDYHATTVATLVEREVTHG